jgi:hypothetical protein
MLPAILEDQAPAEAEAAAGNCADLQANFRSGHNLSSTISRKAMARWSKYKAGQDTSWGGSAFKWSRLLFASCSERYVRS